MRNASSIRTNTFPALRHPPLPREYVDFLVAVRPTLQAAADDASLWQREHRMALLEQANRLIEDIERRWQKPIVFPMRIMEKLK